MRAGNKTQPTKEAMQKPLLKWIQIQEDVCFKAESLRYSSGHSDKVKGTWVGPLGHYIKNKLFFKIYFIEGISMNSNQASS